MTQATTLGELKSTEWASPARRQRTVKDEMRENLICLLENGSPLFPGIVGYEETVLPQLVNAGLSRHNFILLGLRGQGKRRVRRGWPPRFCPATTSFCWDCAVRRRAGSCASS